MSTSQACTIGPRPPGSSRCNSVSSSIGEFIAPPSLSRVSSIISVAVEDPRSTRNDQKNRRRHHRDRQENDIEWDNKRHYDSHPFSYDVHGNEVHSDIYAGGSVEDDMENVFAFKPPTTAEVKQFRATQSQSQFPPSAVAPYKRNTNTSIDYSSCLDDQSFHTLVDYPLNLPQPALCQPGPRHASSIAYRSFSDSIHQGPRLHTLEEGAASRVQSSSSPSCRSPAPSNTHNSSETRCRTHSESHRSSHSKSTKSVSTKPKDYLKDLIDDDDDRTRNSVVSFEFDTETLDEESLKQRRWSYESVGDSPYPEVRASVSNLDDANLPVLTFRMWLVGLTLCSLSAGLNTFFNFRFPAPSIVPLVLVLIAHPFGKFAAYILPISVFRLPPWLRRWSAIEGFSFNPGPWNIKEHACIYLMANVSIAPAYAMNTIVVAEQFYKVRFGLGFNFTLILATQLAGFGLAGFVRRFLVWPASMIWPSNLVVCTLLNTLHAEQDAYSPSISRYKFFTIALCAAFFYYFLPGFLFQALSMFSYVCWIAPDNIIINQLFGVRSGLGMGILTFDWSMISFIGSPLMIPWWAQVHTTCGFVFFFWVLAPILYYTNVWNLARFPMASNIPFDITGHEYNISKVVTSNHVLNVTAYENYSPLYLPTTYAMAYLITFILSTCVLTHTVLYYGKLILNNLRGIEVEEEDVHARLMRRYPEVPNYWYIACFSAFFSIGVVSTQAWPTGMPVWALTLCFILSIVYLLPSGFIYATTGQSVCLNFLGEIIPGVLFPGNPLVNMVMSRLGLIIDPVTDLSQIFKAYSVQSLTGALSFVQGMKLGHYVKIPPRASFIVQVVSTILTSFVQVFVKEWMFGNIRDLCSPTQRDLLTCPQNEVFYTASAVWGLIGPSKQLGKSSTYQYEVYALIIGLLAPIPLWYWRRRYPDTRLPHISLPVFLNGPSIIPPATGINYSSWFAVGFIFQYIIRTRHLSWWSKFNYVLSAALDSGTVLSICAVFLFLQMPHGGLSLVWAGNTIFTKTADWRSASLIPPS